MWLADACFHESTVHALKYYGEHGYTHYGEHGYTHFQPTAEVLQIVGNWWNIVNVKSRTIGRNKRDTYRDETSDKNCDAIKYSRCVADWFERWKIRNPSGGLSRETAFAVKHSTLTIIELVEYLLTKEEFVLLRLIQSDYLESVGSASPMVGITTPQFYNFCKLKNDSPEVSCRIWIQYVRN